MMENFKKIIYKKPEFQNESKKEDSKEKIEYSEKIANEKLKKILEPGFRDFGVRYMNIEEYRTLIENGKLSGEFSLFDKFSREGADFSNFSEAFKDGYYATHSMAITQWHEMSGLASLKTMDLITGIKGLRQEYVGKNEKERDFAIRQFILKYIETGIAQPDSNYNYENNFSRLMSPNAFKNLEYDIKDLEKTKESSIIIKSFMEDENFLSEKDNLRKLIIALSTVHGINGGEDRQYHLALILDSNILKGDSSSWDVEYWRELYESDTKKMDKKEKDASILGVISVYPLKEMHNEIIEMEKSSGDLAHPVFDHRGIIQWPRNEKESK